MVTVGRTRPPQVAKPEAGKMGTSTAKPVSSMMPVQKSGMDCPAMVSTLTPNSLPVSGRRAIHTPSGMATTAVSRIADVARVRV